MIDQLRRSPSTPARRRAAGSTLVATLMVVAVMVTFLSIAALITSQFGRFTNRQQNNTDLMAAADAGLEYLYAQWKVTTSATILGSTGTAPVTGDFAVPATLLASLKSTTLPFSGQGATFTAASIVLTSATDASGHAVGTSTSNVPGYPGWTGQTFNYLATVKVSNTVNSPLTVKRYFQVIRVPLFQSAIFYENRLEIHPGAAMTVTGLVHTNDDLWARGFDTLKFNNNVSYVGNYYEKGDTAITNGWDGNNYGVIPGVGSYANVPLPTWSDGLTSTNSASKATQLNKVSPIDPFGGASQNNNGLHDLIEVPATTNTSPQIAYNNASLIITIDSSKPTSSNSRVTVTDGAGNSLSGPDTAAVKAAVGNGATTTIYDQREATNVTVTNLDMSKLALATVPQVGKTATNLQKAFSGMVYIHDVSTSSSTQPAIRLLNGRDLGQNVTIASDNGVYIQGDYNTGGASPGSVPSNVANTDGSATPQATGYTRYASAVMADAVTILSNNWTDGNSSLALSKRTATATTVNTAILAGDVPSNYNNNHNASGGAHNFPRFLENWNGINFTYWGSLVEAYRSEKFDGLWQTGNVYYWPDRKWNFDTNFLLNQPPGVPSGIQFTRGRWQRE